MQNCRIEKPSLAEDRIVGAVEIAKFIGTTPRSVYHLHREGRLPGVFRFGGQLWGFRSQIDAGLRAHAANGGNNAA